MAKKKSSSMGTPIQPSRGRGATEIGFTRQPEVLGILMMSIGILVSLSIISYTPEDVVIVKSIPAEELFTLEKSPALRIQNWLGVIGAFTSDVMVRILFGYFSLIMPLILLFSGWIVFRRRSLIPYVPKGITLVWSMILGSTLAGWIYNQFEPFSSSWTGGSGIAIAHVLYTVAGVGSSVILGVLALLTLLVWLDPDLQATVDAIGRWKEALVFRLNEWKQKRRENALRRAEAKKAAVHSESVKGSAALGSAVAGSASGSAAAGSPALGSTVGGPTSAATSGAFSGATPGTNPGATHASTPSVEKSLSDTQDEDEITIIRPSLTDKPSAPTAGPDGGSADESKGHYAGAESSSTSRSSKSTSDDRDLDVPFIIQTGDGETLIDLYQKGARQGAVASGGDVTPAVPPSSAANSSGAGSISGAGTSSSNPSATPPQRSDSGSEKSPRPGLNEDIDEDSLTDPLNDADSEIEVIVGEGDEAAGERDLDRINKSVSKEQRTIKYRFPGIDLLDNPPLEDKTINRDEISQNKEIIKNKLAQHKINVLIKNAIVGPTVTLYELIPEEHVKISRIESFADDLKMATAALGIRIIAPIPGKRAVGIEIPNKERETVVIRSMINTRKFVQTDMDLPVAFGATIENDVFMVDLAKLPHLLMAGATGSGKSVGINTIITCLLYKVHPDNLKFVLIDPKKIELSLYRSIQNHYLAYLPDAEEPIITDTSKALETLVSVTAEMDSRYDLLKMAMVRDIKSYNEKFKAGSLEEELGHRHLPYIVVIIDELADLMMTAGRQIEEPIARIAQLARAVGIHLVVATQRPSVNVITGTIKANFPARVAYQVASKVDSRTIIDTGGADELVGRGDMLFVGGSGTTRVQNAFVSTEEVEKVTAFIGNQIGYKSPFLLPKVQDDEAGEGADLSEDIDDLFKDAAMVVLIHQQGSVSLLQRKLKVGYNRAGRLIDQLFSAGIVGPYQGSAARDVLVSTEDELQEIFMTLGI